jgi:hypothetical protein
MAGGGQAPSSPLRRLDLPAKPAKFRLISGLLKIKRTPLEPFKQK